MHRVQHIATSNTAPRNPWGLWTGTAPQIATAGGQEAAQLAAAAEAPPQYANGLPANKTFWTAVADSCRPAEITATDDAGCGRWFPRYHPKNSAP